MKTKPKTRKAPAADKDNAGDYARPSWPPLRSLPAHMI
jgi:hypothetical protein